MGRLNGNILNYLRYIDAMNSCLILFLTIVAILLSMYFFALGIAEAAYLDSHDSIEIKEQCWQVWPNITSLCVLNFLTALLLIPTILAGLGGKSDKGSSGESCTLAGAIRVWTLVIFFNIPQSCIDKYEDSAPTLLTFLAIESYTLLILCGIVGLIIAIVIIYGFYHCIKCCCFPKQQSSDYAVHTDQV